jgi:hypothetical protein
MRPVGNLPIDQGRKRRTARRSALSRMLRARVTRRIAESVEALARDRARGDDVSYTVSDEVRVALEYWVSLDTHDLSVDAVLDAIEKGSSLARKRDRDPHEPDDEGESPPEAGKAR